ncbi:MAG TPA: asparagine synthase (glutamine-hydrolyzing) [Alphaproteobacteria bacterium]|nr:asparagine synthase (glutamine-hydrolyzing) [Alphaproteobacteria bacterium]
MCGIAGVMLRNGGRVKSAVLDALEAAIDHRGPDGSGRHVADAIGLVSTRLAIIDLKTGDQPLSDSDGVVLVANGEIYNDLELRARLHNVPYRTGSDCESPLHLYRARGLDFAKELRGMYAIAIYDPSDSKLVLARDPFGIKPLYYVEAATYFAFASEPQALIAAGLATCEVRRRARAELFQLRFTTGCETIFSSIKRVLPGETLVVVDGKIVERQRLDMIPQGAPREVERSKALASLGELLSDSVIHHLRSDVPYGLFLSGGIDSSVLAALMKRHSAGPVVAMTACFPGTRANDERAAAERVARAIGADHHVLEMTERDFWITAPRLAAALDDPTTDPAALPTFALSELARGYLKVVISGEGADEIFGGYARYRRARWLWGLLARKRNLSGIFDGVTKTNGAFEGWRSGLDVVEADEFAADRTRVQCLQAVDCAEWLPNDLLVKLDRCLMANGLEGRTPFLDPIVADFAFRLPDRMKVTAKFGKWLLREWLSSNLPAAEPFARKKGFNPPVGEWIAAKKDIIEPLVSSQPGIAEFVAKGTVARVFAAPEKHAQAAWSLLFYALWHSHHIVEVPSEGTIEDVLVAAQAA